MFLPWLLDVCRKPAPSALVDSISEATDLRPHQVTEQQDVAWASSKIHGLSLCSWVFWPDISVLLTSEQVSRLACWALQCSPICSQQSSLPEKCVLAPRALCCWRQQGSPWARLATRAASTLMASIVFLPAQMNVGWPFFENLHSTDVGSCLTGPWKCILQS